MADTNPPQKTNPQDKKILVIDDDEAIRLLLKTSFESEGFQVKTSRDGRNILKVSQEFHPHLIITDLMMPGGGGYEVLRSLQSEDVTRTTPVLIITGHTMDKSTKDIMGQEPNFVGLIEKPMRIPLLIHKVHSILKTKTREEKMIEDQKQNVRELDLNKFDDEIL